MHRTVIKVIASILLVVSIATAADMRYRYNEPLVGAGHPYKSDTINRLTLVEHNSDGTHKAFGVASKLDGISANLQQKLINIGDWDMDLNATKTVAHGLTLSKVVAISGMVVSDAGTVKYPVSGGFVYTATEFEVWINSVESSLVYLERRAGGVFDSTAFDQTSYNRGWIIITYTE